MEYSKDLVDAGELALDLLSPANEPKQRVQRTGLQARDRLFSIVADAYPYLPRQRQELADWLYDMHVRAVQEKALEQSSYTPPTLRG